MNHDTQTPSIGFNILDLVKLALLFGLFGVICLYAVFPNAYYSTYNFIHGIVNLIGFFGLILGVAQQLISTQYNRILTGVGVFFFLMLSIALSGASEIFMYALIASGYFFILKNIFASNRSQYFEVSLPVLVTLFMFVTIFWSFDPTTFPKYAGLTFAFLHQESNLTDMFIHTTYINSILNYGYPSTGLHGVLLVKYHAIGHYVFAGIYRLTDLNIITPTSMFGRFVILILLFLSCLTSLTIFLQRINKAPDSKITSILQSVAITSVFFVFFYYLTSFFPATVFHVFVISNGISLLLAGLIYATLLFVIVLQKSSNNTSLNIGRKELVLFLAVLLFILFSKISTGLVIYCSVFSYLFSNLIGFHSKQIEFRNKAILLIFWTICGGVCATGAYVYISVTSNNSSLFNFAIAGYLFNKTKVLYFYALTFSIINAVIWIALLYFLNNNRVYKSILSVILVSFSGFMATSMIMVLGIATNYNDLAYMHVSALQVNLFGIVVALALMIAMIVQFVVTKMNAYRYLNTKPVGQLFILLAAALLVYMGASLHSWSKTRTKQVASIVCAYLSDKACKPLANLNSEDFYSKIKFESDILDIVKQVENRPSNFLQENTFIIIDNASSFFHSAADSNWKKMPCYWKGWSVYTATKIPLLYGVPRRDKSPFSCSFVNNNYDYLWKRYGYATYVSADSQARSFVKSDFEKLCRKPEYLTSNFVYFDKDLSPKYISCGELNSSATAGNS